MNINVVDARPMFKKVLVDVYKEAVEATGYLRGMFENKETSGKTVSIEVQRGFEKVAVDVFRGQEGNRNDFSKFTEKVILPPYFNEYIDHTSIRNYDVLFGQAAVMITEETMADLVSDVSSNLVQLQAKIERAYEVQCAQVLQTGIVTLKSADSIDFKRKAASIVDLGAGNYWGDAAVDPIKAIEDGCKFLREVGKSQGGEFNVTLGGTALSTLLANEAFQKKGDLRNISLVDISMPQRQSDSVGSAFHGILSAGSFKVRIFTYPQSYDDATGTAIPYIDDDKMVITPMNPRFTMAFAAVDKIVRNPGNTEFPEFISSARGAYTIGNFIDGRAKSHVFDISSAGVPVPTAIDTIYTAKVTA